MHVTPLLEVPYKPSFPIYSLPELPAKPKTDDSLKCIVLAAHTPTQRGKKKMFYIYSLYPKWEKYKKPLSHILSWALWKWSSWGYPPLPWLTYKVWVWVGQRVEERERKRKENLLCSQIFQVLEPLDFVISCYSNSNHPNQTRHGETYEWGVYFHIPLIVNNRKEQECPQGGKDEDTVKWPLCGQVHYLPNEFMESIKQRQKMLLIICLVKMKDTKFYVYFSCNPVKYIGTDRDSSQPNSR